MKKYVTPDMEVVEFDCEDVIATSCGAQIEQLECGCYNSSTCQTDWF